MGWKIYNKRNLVIKNNDGTYDLWYSGGVREWQWWNRIRIFKRWNKLGKIIEQSNISSKWWSIIWRNNRTYTPFVIKDGCGYKCGFSGRDSNDSTIGFAYTPCNLSGYKWNDINQDGIWNSRRTNYSWMGNLYWFE